MESRKKWKGMIIIKMTVMMDRNPIDLNTLVEVRDRAWGSERGWNHKIYMFSLS
jgi:hypothetical protein